MLPRLILVSNRVAVPDPKGPRQAGGLAIAVNAALKRREGIWFGWSGRVSEDSTGLEPAVVESAQRTYITLDLSPSDFQEYYNGFANRVCGRSSITASISRSLPRSISGVTCG